MGEEYQDHHLLLYPYRTKNLDAEETLDGILSGRKDFVKALGEEDPMLGWNGIGKKFQLREPLKIQIHEILCIKQFTNLLFFLDICAKLRPSDKDIEALGPDFKRDWDNDFKPFPTRPMMLCGVVNAFLADPSLVDPGKQL